jgi:hypothetical protein
MATYVVTHIHMIGIMICLAFIAQAIRAARQGGSL